jgi:hypothetical protein
MADLVFIPLIVWHPNTVLVIHWRCGPVLGTQRGDLCLLLYSLVGILCSSLVEDFDVGEVCCKTVVACVEPEVCDCMVSGFGFVIFPRGFDILPLCLIG